jgi:hypothetical protein
MKIKIKKYDYQTIDDKLTKIEVKQHWLYQKFANIILFIFKLINFRHVYNKDEYNRYVVREILEIRGLRTCAYAGIGGQIYISTFLFKFGKYYI